MLSGPRSYLVCMLQPGPRNERIFQAPAVGHWELQGGAGAELHRPAEFSLSLRNGTRAPASR